MAEQSEISWTDAIGATGRKFGAHKSAAKKAGCSVEEWYALRADGRRWCYRCRSWKAIEMFAKDRSKFGGYACICKICNNIRATRCVYGLTEDQFASLTASGMCPICERRGVKMEVDHCHKSGVTRAIICSRCNNGLGAFCDEVGLMRRAIAYLERYHG